MKEPKISQPCRLPSISIFLFLVAYYQLFYALHSLHYSTPLATAPCFSQDGQETGRFRRATHPSQKYLTVMQWHENYEIMWHHFSLISLGAPALTKEGYSICFLKNFMLFMKKMAMQWYFKNSTSKKYLSVCNRRTTGWKGENICFA